MNKILVIGDIMLDTYLIGGCSRISAEAPVGVVKVDTQHLVLGGAGNVVRNIISLGGQADIMSVVGQDTSASEIKTQLTALNISHSYLFTEEGRVTTTKTRVLAAKQQVIRYDNETTDEITPITQQLIRKQLHQHVGKYRIIILSDYGKGVLSDKLVTDIIALAKQQDIKVLVDPKGSDYKKYQGAYLLTPNKKEAQEASGIQINADNLELALKTLKDIAHLTKSVITLSEEGIAVYDDTLRIYPTQAKEVFDVTGAGDTVIAAIAVKLLETTDIDEAIRFANMAAGVVVGKIGSAIATLDEIHSYQHTSTTQHKLYAIQNITRLCESLRKRGKTIVFTNGCFDILHLGHIKYLEEAKLKADVLIVGVNTNNSVKHLKGESRPINDEYDRAYILTALTMVDYVVLFDADTPYELIKLIQPEVLVKGADYADQTIVGSDIAGCTELIDLVAGKSTTNIIHKILG